MNKITSYGMISTSSGIAILAFGFFYDKYTNEGKPGILGSLTIILGSTLIFVGFIIALIGKLIDRNINKNNKR